uniref:Uncharacterized protein n=1 Tax=viral metagenome TaxID=1070528 RepID=A0A6H1ZI57_9ZZZZ
MKKLFISFGAVAIILAGVFYFCHESPPEQVLGDVPGGKVATTTGQRISVVGSRSSGYGTTTTGVGFYTYTTNGTTTYPFRIGNSSDSVTFYLKTTDASTTAGVYFSLLASNDPMCQTATTSTTENLPTVEEIDWFDVGLLAANYASTVTIPAATTTFEWLPTKSDQNRTITLTNLNADCLAFEVNGTSTVFFVEAITKSFSKGY